MTVCLLVAFTNDYIIFSKIYAYEQTRFLQAIIHAVENVFPESEHMNCVRHIYANWHKTHKG